MSDWIDVSIPLRMGMPQWPDDTPARFHRILDVAKGDRFTLTIASMTVHTGTHVDAPAHFLPGGACMDAMPLDVMAGEARVIEIEDEAAIRPEELARHGIARGERVLFKTRNSTHCWKTDEFVTDAVELTDDAARYLADAGVRCVGIDYMSVGSDEAHRILMGAGVWCIEWLNLEDVPAGKCEFLCLPLRVAGAEGAPARALLRPL